MNETDYTHIKSIGGLALLALLVRVIYLQLQGGNPLFATPSLDELYHYEWALDIARGNWLGERAFFRAPLYSYLLGILFWLAGANLGPGPLFYIATLLQHAGGVAACVLIYFLTLKLFNRRGVAFTAMGLASLYAPAIFFEGQLLDISLQALLLPLVLLLAIRAFNTGKPLDFLWLGLAGGAAVIARPASLPWFVIIAALSPWLVRPPRRVRRLRARRAIEAGNGESPDTDAPSQNNTNAHDETPSLAERFNAQWAWRLAAMAGGLAIAIGPVAWHNWKAEGVFVPIATYAGVNFWIGNNASADGFTSKTPERYIVFGQYQDSVEVFARQQASADTGRTLDSAQLQRYWFRRGVDEILAEPLRWIGLMAKKTILIWNGFEIKNNKNIYVYQQFNPLLRALLFVFNFGLIMPFALAGLLLTWRQSDPLAWRLTGLMLLTLLAGVVLFFVNARYRFPFAWLLLPFAAAGMAAVVDRIRALRQSPKDANNEERTPAKNVKRLAKAVAAVGIAFVFINSNLFAIRQSQNLSEDYWSVANAWRENGDLEEALLYYRKALELNNYYCDAYNGLGETYYQQGQFREAEEAFKRALITAGPDRWAEVRALNNLGVTAEARGELDQAILYYQQTLDKAPEHALAWQNLGDVLRARNEWSEAKRAYKRAHELAAELPLPLLGLAACAAQSGNEQMAVEYARQFLSSTGEAGLQKIRETAPLAQLLPQIAP